MQKEIIRKLDQEHLLSSVEWEELLRSRDESVVDYAATLARKRTQEVFGNKIYTRGLIEVSNYCKNNCYYCGIRRDNKKVSKYRLTKEDILLCAKTGYDIGFRTFVLQGGEDMYYQDEVLADIVSSLRQSYPDCAITLSLGERSRKSYELLYRAGANRYLLRHETADRLHYESLHPQEMSYDNRRQCLADLKDIGYQVGCGFMVGSPGQSVDTLRQDMEFLTELQPDMVGIGPFIPHGDTPFGKEKPGRVEDTLYYLSLIRLLLPKVLLPATTALGTLDEQGREKGILSGANVVMPNLSPVSVREKYELYDNKLCTGEEAAESWMSLNKRMESIGYQLVKERGDAPE